MEKLFGLVCFNTHVIFQAMDMSDDGLFGANGHERWPDLKSRLRRRLSAVANGHGRRPNLEGNVGEEGRREEIVIF